VLQDNPEKPGIAGYHENSLYGAGHVGHVQPFSKNIQSGD
jgi:hypothetical protein